MRVTQIWDNRIKVYDKVRNSGKCCIYHMKMGTVTRLHVVCPHNQDFIIRARLLEGKWKHRTRVWSFDLVKYQEVKDLCISVYGRENVTA